MFDKLKQEANSYEIKTSSNQILNKYHDTNKNTNPSKKVNYIALIPALLACFVSVGVIISNINKTNTIINSEDDIISLEISSGISLVKAKTNNVRQLKQAKLEQNEFNKICDDFMDSYTILEQSVSYKNNNVAKAEKGEFVVDGITYTSKVSIDENSTLYYLSNEYTDKKEYKEKYEGILIIDNVSYEVDGKRSLNTKNNEDEIDLTIYVDENTHINIEQESERSEFSYSYSIVEYGKTTYEIEIDFEKDEIEMECYKENVEYEYSIVSKKNYYLVDYEISKGENELEGSFRLTIVESKYTFQDKKNDLIYNIYQ